MDSTIESRMVVHGDGLDSAFAQGLSELGYPEAAVIDGRLVFRTVVPTPKPRVLDMELRRGDGTTVRRPGGSLEVVRFTLLPTINWLVDPIVRMVAPETQFLVQPGTPPSLARFQGPRNYTGQKIRIE
jgi:hypothetical protein